MSKHSGPKKPAVEDWHPADIVAALRKSGWSLRALSQHHGYHPSALKHALAGPYPRAERLIAEAIGVAPEEIWPRRFEQRAQHTTRGQGRRRAPRRGDGHSTAGAA